MRTYTIDGFLRRGESAHLQYLRKEKEEERKRPDKEMSGLSTMI
jgi:hypothetical protein